MKITVDRSIYSDYSTISNVLLDGSPFSNILELSCRRPNKDGHMAIFAGLYQFKITDSPDGLQNFKPPLPRLPLILGVVHPDGTPREGIRIHPANWPSQLEGCQAPGIYDPHVPDFVGASRVTFDRLFREISAADIRHEPLWIEVIGGPVYMKAVA